MTSKLYDWDLRNIAKISPQLTKNRHFWTFLIFSKTVHTIGTSFSQSLYTILGFYVCNDVKVVWLGSEKQPKLVQKLPNDNKVRNFSIV